MSKLFLSRLKTQYSLLPTTSSPISTPLPKRYTRLGIAVLLSIGLVLLFECTSLAKRPRRASEFNVQYYPDVRYPETRLTPLDSSGLPPLYPAFREYEDAVSKWNLEQYGLRGDRYIYFANHAYGAGWGNVMQDMVLSALLASTSGRGYVWEDYTWNRDGSDYSQFNGKSIPSKMPLSTMISGHLLGLPVYAEPQPELSRETGSVPLAIARRSSSDPNNALPPSISRRVYDIICPKQDRVYIDRTMVKALLGLNASSVIMEAEMTGKEILDAWMGLLDSPGIKDQRCLEVKQDTEQVFDIWVIHTPRLHSLLDMLYLSPVLTNWDWSELVKSLFCKNVGMFVSAKLLLASAPRPWFGSFFSSPPPPPSMTIDNKTVPLSLLRPTLESKNSSLPLLVLHLRRGDYEAHCFHLSKYNALYNGMATLPEFETRDKFVRPRMVNASSPASRPLALRGGSGDPEEVSSQGEMDKVYIKHCIPDVAQIKRRVREVVRDYNLFVEEAEEKKRGWWPRWSRASHRRGQMVEGNKRLRKVYLMSNGDEAWLEEVKKALLDDVELPRVTDKVDREEKSEWEFLWDWEGIATSRDLVAGWEESRVLQVVDMFVAQRAELFVGNGFSSLTTNIVMLRRKLGFDPVQTRFW